LELTPFSRVTSNMQSAYALQDMGRNLQALLRIQQQIGSGRRIVMPSMDPVGANSVMEFQDLLERQTQYVRNIDMNAGQLEMSDAALTSVFEVLVEARELAIEQANDISSNAETRLAASRQVTELMNEIVNVANRRFGRLYVFGGSETEKVPFVVMGDSVLYNGNGESVQIGISDGAALAANVTGVEAFGALTAKVGAGGDLDPILSDGAGGDRATLLADLNRGTGVRKGSIRISDGTTSVDVNLSDAEDVGDVVSMINGAAGGLVTASLTATGITLTAVGGPVTVEEVAGGSTAFDLGILQPTPAGVVVGSDLDPALNLLTDLSLLGGGAGLDLSGITITNGTHSASISFAGATTVQDVLNVINGAGVYVEAGINDAGTGIVVRSRLSGVTMTVEENGGTSAAELGVLETTGVTSESVFSSLLRLREALIANDQAGISAEIGGLDDAMNIVLDAQATVGTRVQRLELTSARLSNERLYVSSMLSSLQDVDMAQAAVEFQQQQNALQASLAMAAAILRPSLLDYLT